MKTGFKKVISVLTSIIVLSGLIGLGHSPMIVHADEPGDASIEIIFDGALDETGVRKVSTFNVNGTDVVLTFIENISTAVLNGSRLQVSNDSREAIFSALSGAVDSITGYDPNTMDIVLETRETGGGTFRCTLGYNSTDGFFRADGSEGGIVTNGEHHFNITPKQNNGNGQPGPNQGDSVAHITAESPGMTWTGVPCVYEDYYPFIDDNGTVEWNTAQQKSWQYCKISVNGSRSGGFTDDGVRHTANPNSSVDVQYDAGDDPEHVDVTFSFSWSYRPADVININGTEYRVSDYLNFDDRQAWLDAFSFEYRNQDVSFTIDDVPANLDGDGVANLGILIDLRPISWSECFIGNFLWSSNPNPDNPDDDMYIGHSSLSLISATYPEWLGGRTFKEDVLESESRSSKNDKTARYITYGVTNGDGEMVLPIGTKVTMRVAPDFGYQVTAFKINGTPLERDSFDTGTDVAVYTFTIESANFHLGADVVEVGNEVVAANANGISGGGISLGGRENSMSIGTAKLEVEDIDPSGDEVSGFKNASNGYEITNYVDISLFNSVYKGTDRESWDTQVRSLDNSATITLALDSDADGKEFVVIHEVSEGNFEQIETTYNASNNTISFSTRSFSNYAIAQRDQTAQKEPNCPMYRMYNPNSGEHFYTGSLEEKSNLTAAGWNYEGVAFNAAVSDIGHAPVYRVYNPNAGDHHFTASADEKNNLVNAGWKYEGIAWYSGTEESGEPVFRLYNPNAESGAHHYTSSVAEKNHLTSIGWNYEGVAWFGI